MSASTQASVVFLKIGEFERRPASEQARLRAQLEAVVAVTTAEIEPASRVVLEASDGAAIVVLGDPPGALRLAERSLAAAAAGLPLSAGINHGAVQLAGGNGGAGMTGDGIAVAASVAEFSAPGRLLAARAFRDALADFSPGLEASLARAGTFTDPGLRAHELYGPDRDAARRRGRRYGLAAGLLVIALVGGGIGSRLYAEGQQPFVNAMAKKVEPYWPDWRALVQKVRF